MKFFIFFSVVIVLNLSFCKRITAFSHTIYYAALISVITSAIFQILAYIFMGYLDPFFILAMSIQIVIAFLIGFAINLIIFRMSVHQKKF